MWYVVAWKMEGEPDPGPDDRVWTVSRDPEMTGWETDTGCPGYGLTKADAEELANTANKALSK